MAVVYLGLGSNLDPEKNLRLAIRELHNRFRLQTVSTVYRSAALGFDGAEFLNAVACVETDMPAEDVVTELEAIHAVAGRQRQSKRYISRTLDIDLLLYNRLVNNALRIPRADVLEYSFVLRPLAEIAPDYVHPISEMSLREHWLSFDELSHPLIAENLVL